MCSICATTATTASCSQLTIAESTAVDPFSLLWLFFILASLQPAVTRQLLFAQRRRALHGISRRRGATVITLIHRQESLSLLGIPLVRYIDIDDAEGVLRGIHETPSGRPIEIVLHTPGGLVVAARQIASALADHDGHVTGPVPGQIARRGVPSVTWTRNERERPPTCSRRAHGRTTTRFSPPSFAPSGCRCVLECRTRSASS